MLTIIADLLHVSHTTIRIHIFWDSPGILNFEVDVAPKLLPFTEIRQAVSGYFIGRIVSTRGSADLLDTVIDIVLVVVALAKSAYI
jgi:hypothetical protein